MSKASKYRVLVTVAGIPRSAIDFLTAQNCEVDEWDRDITMPHDEFIKRVANVDAIFCTSYNKIGKDVIDAALKLKVVSSISVGTDHFDRVLLKQRGVRMGYTPDVCTEAMCELLVSLVLATIRKVNEGALAIRSGEWPDGWRPLWMCGDTIYGSTLGFVGFGKTGQGTARRLKAFQPVKVLYHCRTRKSEIEGYLGVTWCEHLDEMITSVDILIVCCALNETTRHLMSKKRLSLMKRGSYFFNMSRGLVVDQDGLVDLLAEGHFAGVGLDVTTPEPLPTSHPLLKFPNCLVLPHISSASVKTRERMADLVVKNIMAALEGGEMPAEFV